jgi:hypothetical protein
VGVGLFTKQGFRIQGRVADSNTIVNRWKSYFSQLLNVHNVSEVR